MVSKTLGQVPQYPYSLASARQQMAESAYPHGFTAQSTSSPAQRLAIYGQVLRQVGTDEPYVVLYGGLSFTALSGKFTLPGFYEYPAFFSWALRLRQAG